MSEISIHVINSDMPVEGIHNKWIETLLSPTNSEINDQIASYEPQFVEQIRKGVGRMRTTSSAKLLMGSYSSLSKRSSGTSIGSMKDGFGRLLSDPDRDIGLSVTARDIFGRYAKPHDILAFFHKYDNDVLNSNDISSVAMTTSQYGDQIGALELYDRLQEYDEWLPCTISVLRDTKVNMNELADLLLLHLGMEQTANKVLNDPENHDRIVAMLKDKFRMLLKPLVILPLFHKYDPKVLVQDDIDFVAALTIEEGDVLGSDELLDRLVRYPGWYPCLMSVLRDPLVNLGYLVDELSSALSEEFSEIKEAEQTAKRAYQSQQMEYDRLNRERRRKGKKGIASQEGTGTMPSRKPSTRRPSKSLMKEKPKGQATVQAWTGLDFGKELAPHKMNHLPLEVELAHQKMECLRNMEVDEVISEPGLHERMFDPRVEGEKYVEKFAITELLTFMLTRDTSETRKPCRFSY